MMQLKHTGNWTDDAAGGGPVVAYRWPVDQLGMWVTVMAILRLLLKE